MKELWRSFMDSQTFAVRVMRTLCLGTALFLLTDPETLKQWVLVGLGGGSGLLGAGQPNAKK